jgi:hypothetical protein
LQYEVKGRDVEWYQGSLEDEEIDSSSKSKGRVDKSVCKANLEKHMSR